MNDNNGKALAIIEPPKQQIQEMADRILPMWQKECTPEQARNVARLALLYGLDPFADEIIPYRGRPYIGLAGRLRKAHESGKFQGIIDDRLATDEERRANGVNAADTLWYVSVKRADWIRPNGRFGRFKGGETTVTGDPPLMARNRALRRALKEAFPMSLPGVLEDEAVETVEREPERVTVVEMANQGQIAALHILKEKLGLSEEQYHQELRRFYCVGSSKELTTFQAEDLVNAWSERLEQAQKPKMDPATRADLYDAYGVDLPSTRQAKAAPQPSRENVPGIQELQRDAAEAEQAKAEPAVRIYQEPTDPPPPAMVQLWTRRWQEAQELGIDHPAIAPDCDRKTMELMIDSITKTIKAFHAGADRPRVKQGELV